MDTLISAIKILLNVAMGYFVLYFMGRVWAKAMRDGKGSGEVNIIIIPSHKNEKDDNPHDYNIRNK